MIEPESAHIHIILLMTELIRSLVPTLQIIAHIHIYSEKVNNKNTITTTIVFLIPREGGEKSGLAISVHTLRGGRKRDPQHYRCGKNKGYQIQYLELRLHLSTVITRIKLTDGWGEGGEEGISWPRNAPPMAPRVSPTPRLTVP